MYRTDLELCGFGAAAACQFCKPQECVSACVLPPIWSGATMSHLCMSVFLVSLDVTYHDVCFSHEICVHLD